MQPSVEQGASIRNHAPRPIRQSLRRERSGSIRPASYIGRPANPDRGTAVKPDNAEIQMRIPALVLSAIVLVSAGASAQPNTKPSCPDGYSLVGPICQDKSSGDIVLPN